MCPSQVETETGALRLEGTGLRLQLFFRCLHNGLQLVYTFFKDLHNQMSDMCRF